MNHSSTDVKRNFGSYIRKSAVEPIIIESTHKPVAVLMSYEKYLEYIRLEDLYWEARAIEAEKSGLLSVEESLKFTKDALKA